MKKLCPLLIFLILALTTQAQNGTYVTKGYAYYKTPGYNQPDITTDHKYVLTVSISEFLGQGTITIKDLTENYVITLTCTGKTKETNAEGQRIAVYYGTISFYTFSNPTSIMLFSDEKTGELSIVATEDPVTKSQGLYAGLKPIEKTLGSSGSGFLISSNGLIVTNYHVVADAKEITITGINNDFQKEYYAKVVAYDEEDDMVLLKVQQPPPYPALPYSIIQTQKEVGDDVFVLGYPLLQSMGYEIKLTNGLISSRSGYTGDLNYYQISSPIQPGNSGGPLFDADGNIIGIVSAKLTSAENVGYAIKSKVLCNFLSSAGITLNNSTQIKSIIPLSAKVKALKKYVVIIKAKR